MKRIIFISLVLFFTFPSISQTLNEKIKGNWYHCDKEMGYVEITVYDTILSRKFMLDNLVMNSPLIYGTQDNEIVINPRYPEISETIKVNVLNNEMIVFSGFTYKKDTLHLIERNIPDFKRKLFCEMEMTPRQYSEYLETEYELRRIKKRHKCISPLINRIRKEFQPVDNEQLPKEFADFFADTTRISAISNFVDYKIIDKSPQSDKRTEFVDLITNEKSNDALLIIDEYAKCYTDYNHRVNIVNDELIDVILKPIDYGCEKKCRKRLYIWVSLENYKIKGIKINGETIK